MVIFQDTLTKRLIEHLLEDTLRMCADCLLPLEQLYLAVTDYGTAEEEQSDCTVNQQ